MDANIEDIKKTLSHIQKYDNILVTAPRASGKTTFICDVIDNLISNGVSDIIVVATDTKRFEKRYGDIISVTSKLLPGQYARVIIVDEVPLVYKDEGDMHDTILYAMCLVDTSVLLVGTVTNDSHVFSKMIESEMFTTIKSLSEISSVRDIYKSDTVGKFLDYLKQ